MHELAGAFYGRADVYAEALSEATTLQAVIVRNVLGGRAAFAEALARHVQHLAETQSNLAWQALLTPDGWPAFVA
jgi:hypothetical protein